MPLNYNFKAPYQVDEGSRPLIDFMKMQQMRQGNQKMALQKQQAQRQQQQFEGQQRTQLAAQQKQAAIQDVMGRYGDNIEAAIPELYKIDPVFAQKLEQQNMQKAKQKKGIEAFAMTNKKNIADLTKKELELNRDKYKWWGSIVGNSKTPEQYETARQFANTVELGIDVPEQYNPEYVDMVKNQATDYEQQYKEFIDMERLDQQRELAEVRTKQKAVEPKTTERQRFSQEQQLRSQFDGMAKNYITVRDAYKKVKTSVKNESPAGDLALIFNYMKVLDPGSVVRESEFANAAATGAFGEKVKAAAAKVVTGQRLTDVQRQDFLTSTENIFREQQRSFEDLKKKYSAIAKQYDLSPDRVVGGFDVETGTKNNDPLGIR